MGTRGRASGVGKMRLMAPAGLLATHVFSCQRPLRSIGRRPIILGIGIVRRDMGGDNDARLRPRRGSTIPISRSCGIGISASCLNARRRRFKPQRTQRCTDGYVSIKLMRTLFLERWRIYKSRIYHRATPAEAPPTRNAGILPASKEVGTARNAGVLPATINRAQTSPRSANPQPGDCFAGRTAALRYKLAHSSAPGARGNPFSRGHSARAFPHPRKTAWWAVMLARGRVHRGQGSLIAHTPQIAAGLPAGDRSR